MIQTLLLDVVFKIEEKVGISYYVDLIFRRRQCKIKMGLWTSPQIIAKGAP